MIVSISEREVPAIDTTRVLVFGAGGGIGRTLCTLLNTSVNFTSIPVFSHRNPSAVAGTYAIDIADHKAVASLVKAVAPDAIVLLAGITGESCNSDVDLTEAVNVDSVRIIYESAGDVGVRQLLFPSTSGVYGDRYSGPVTESGTLDIRSLYAETKLRAEVILRSEARTGGPSATIFRIFNVYGAAFPSSLLQRLITSSPNNRPQVRQLDDFVRDYIHVRDVAEAMMAALSPRLANKSTTLNIGTGVARSNRELIRELSHHHRVYYDLASGDPSYSCADIGAAAQELGFEPSRALMLDKA